MSPAPTYADVYGFPALLAAFRKARRAKRGKGGEPAFYRDLEANLQGLSEELQTRTWRPQPYRYFTLRVHKERVVSEAAFRDRVVHHSLVAAEERAFEPGFLPDSYACRLGKGSHAAIQRAQQLYRRYRYFLRMDVQKYFDHVDHDALLGRLAERIPDEGILWLSRTLLNASRVPGVPDAERRGLPIGNLSSQFWANVYLDVADQAFAAEFPGLPYLRYMDDTLVLADDKATLWAAARWMGDFLPRQLKLELKEQATVVAPVSEGIPWLGFRIWGRLIRIQHEGRRRFGRRMAASIRDARRSILAQEAEVDRGASLCGHLMQANAAHLRHDILDRLGAFG
jgi:hypothetical protein